MKMVLEETIKISTETKQRLFELQCAWKLHTFEETIKKLIQKAKKEETKK
jgi:hypothetical protein